MLGIRNNRKLIFRSMPCDPLIAQVKTRAIYRIIQEALNENQSRMSDCPQYEKGMDIYGQKKAK